MKENKQLCVEFCDTSRSVVNFVNSEGIQKENILALHQNQSSYVLFYFK